MSRTGRTALVMGACIAASLLLAAGSGAKAKLTADYRFEGNLKSSAGDARKLAEVGTGGQFKKARVGGSKQGVWKWPAGDGLRLEKAGKVMGSKGATYSFVMLVNLDAVDGYRKLVDFDNLQVDPGWYVYNESLYPYNLSDFDYSKQLVQAGKWRQIALTRNGKGVVRGFVGDKKIGSASDPAEDETLGLIDRVLTFLMDDSATTGEESAGSIARLRIWDNALSARKIKGLGK